MLSQDTGSANMDGGRDSRPTEIPSPSIQNGRAQNGYRYDDGTHLRAVNDIECPICLKSCNGPTALAFHLVSAHREENNEDAAVLPGQNLTNKSEAEGISAKDEAEQRRLDESPQSEASLARMQSVSHERPETQGEAQSSEPAASDRAPNVDEACLPEKPEVLTEHTDQGKDHTPANKRALPPQDVTVKKRSPQRQWLQIQTLLHKNASENEEVEKREREVAAKNLAEEELACERIAAARLAEEARITKGHELAELKRAEEARKAEEARFAAARKEFMERERKRDEEIKALEEARMAKERETFLAKLRAAQKQLEDERQERLEVAEEMRAAAERKLAELDRLEEERMVAGEKIAETNGMLAPDRKTPEELKAVDQQQPTETQPEEDVNAKKQQQVTKDFRAAVKRKPEDERPEWRAAAEKHLAEHDRLEEEGWIAEKNIAEANGMLAPERKTPEELKAADQQQPTEALPEENVNAKKQQAAKDFKAAVRTKVAEDRKSEIAPQRAIDVKQQEKAKALVEEQRSKWGALFHIPGHKKPDEPAKPAVKKPKGSPVKVKVEPAKAVQEKPAEQLNMSKENVKYTDVKAEIDQTAILAKIAAMRAQREEGVSRMESTPATPDAATAAGAAMSLGGPVQPVNTFNDEIDVDDTASNSSDLITF